MLTQPQPSAVEGLGSPPCVFWVQRPLVAASVTLLIPTYSENCVLNIHFDGQEARGRELLMTALRKIIKSLSWNGLKATCFLPCILVGSLLLFLRAWGSALCFLLFWLVEYKWPSQSDFLSLILTKSSLVFDCNQPLFQFQLPVAITDSVSSLPAILYILLQ